MEKVILICSCRGQKQKAIDAFNMLYPNEVLPDIIKGRDKVMKYAQAQNNEHLKAIAKLSGRYSYYVELKDGIIVKEVNLTNGRRLA